jgi:hypothetical protein
MSVFYDEASLVVVPSGYKSGKIYAQKPLTTDGQLTFTRGSTATRVNASGLIEEVASGLPRLDYLNSSCPRLLLEPQRTNAALYSEQFNNAAYASDATISVTANSLTSPDGSQNADTIASAIAGLAYIYQNITVTSGLAYTVSVFAKAGTTNFLQLDTVNNVRGAYFNLATGVVAQVVNGTAKIENYGNGWYRCSVTETASSTGGIVLLMPPTASGSTTAAIGNSIYAWGAQCEAGAYPTSVIPTNGTSVTRVADAASKTGISSLIGSTEGTLFADIQATATGYWYISLSSGSNANWVFIGQDETFGSNLRAFLRSGSVTTADIYTGVITSGRYKMAIAYKLNDVVFYVNGTQIGVDTSAVMPTGLANLYISSSDASGGDQTMTGAVNQALLFKTRLTNAQLAELTTL